MLLFMNLCIYIMRYRCLSISYSHISYLETSVSSVKKKSFCSEVLFIHSDFEFQNRFRVPKENQERRKSKHIKRERERDKRKKLSCSELVETPHESRNLIGTNFGKTYESSSICPKCKLYTTPNTS